MTGVMNIVAHVTRLRIMTTHRRVMTKSVMTMGR